MRQLISGLVAAIAVMTAAPAMACGLFDTCSPCTPCAAPQVYVSPAPSYGYSGCNTGCGGWAYERLPDPVHQYYYVNQGPTYTGPGNFAPYQGYEENALPAWGYRHHRHYWGHHYGYMGRPAYGYRHMMRRYY
jgi:hypothetical protein